MLVGKLVGGLEVRQGCLLAGRGRCPPRPGRSACAPHLLPFRELWHRLAQRNFSLRNLQGGDSALPRRSGRPGLFWDRRCQMNAGGATRRREVPLLSEQWPCSPPGPGFNSKRGHASHWDGHIPGRILYACSHISLAGGFRGFRGFRERCVPRQGRSMVWAPWQGGAPEGFGCFRLPGPSTTLALVRQYPSERTSSFRIHGVGWKTLLRLGQNK